MLLDVGCLQRSGICTCISVCGAGHCVPSCRPGRDDFILSDAMLVRDMSCISLIWCQARPRISLWQNYGHSQDPESLLHMLPGVAADCGAG
eukprot:2856131-Amphidinium_carterae.1